MKAKGKMDGDEEGKLKVTPKKVRETTKREESIGNGVKEEEEEDAGRLV